ncbi:hypothetical protein DIPPA_05681 [Diplonema papillatum]|nr:hypothetical protein DIPPA_05681 [Diplonema papillatum]|eukprot:gene10787-16610_t
MIMHEQPVRFALLMPLPSERHASLAAVEEKVRRAAASYACDGKRFELCVVLGIQKGDAVLDTERAKRRLVEAVRPAVSSESCVAVIVAPQTGSAMCNALSSHAWKQLKPRFVVLMDTGCGALSRSDRAPPPSSWPEAVVDCFGVEESAFGCVAFSSSRNPGCPAAVVVGEQHGKLFEAGLVPADGVPSADAGRFVFALYRRFAASRLCVGWCVDGGSDGAPPAAGIVSDEDPPLKAKDEQRVIEAVNGVVSTQLERGVAQLGWDDESWAGALRKVAGECGASPKLTMDVCVPSYRVEREFLERIAGLAAEGADVRVVITVDDPAADVGWLRAAALGKAGGLRVRQHVKNQGASQARNTCLRACDADWIVWLDDDVIPHPRILDAYASAIKEDGHRTDGFVGTTILPLVGYNGFAKDLVARHASNAVFHHAVHLSDVASFWNVAQKGHARLPWGVTANICTRRTAGAAFENFIKTGGGEDIDYCLRLKTWPMLAAPDALAVHPWWSDGNRCYNRFLKWALGDSGLISVHSKYTYITFPNWLELCILYSVAFVASQMLNFPFSAKRWIVLCASTMAIDAVLEVTRFAMRSDTASACTGALRLAASMEAWVLKAVFDVGHFWGPIRFGFFGFCHRFEWFCGLCPAVVRQERRRQFAHFVCHAAGAALCLRWL